jgi:PilZ domain
MTRIPAFRRTGRIAKEIPILLLGCDVDGKFHSETTKTVLLSAHGAAIVSRHKLVAEQEMLLRSLVTNMEAEIRVIGEMRTENGLHTYGVAFRDPILDFWLMPFPSAGLPPGVSELLHLECSNCASPAALENAGLESEVCAIHGGLVRHCAQCGMLTVWKALEPLTRTVNAPQHASGSARSVAVMESHPEQSNSHKANHSQSAVSTSGSLGRYSTGPSGGPGPSAGRGQENRRTLIRAKVNFFACVRSIRFNEDIVTCIDMSKGGLSFRSKHSYQEKDQVQIAVPFSPEAREAPAIFVRARIVNARQIPESKMYRFGVEYIPPNANDFYD